MMYYDDPDKITYDYADTLVERYALEYSDRRSRVRSEDVANAYDVEASHHNLIRINEALKKRFEITQKGNARATQFKLCRKSKQKSISTNLKT